MSLIENRSNQSSDDWGVVIQSVPSKSRKNILKQLEQIFQLDKRDAEQVLANMPLILIDNIPFALAARIKKHFQDLGAVSETTNHDMIKKNCFQVVWPQVPDLAFFLKNQTVSAGVSPAEKPVFQRAAEIPAPEKEFVAEKPVEVPAPEKMSVIEKSADVPPSEKKTAAEKPKEVPFSEKKAVPEKSVVEDMPRNLDDVLSDDPASEAPASDLRNQAFSGEKPASSSPSAINPSWERRAKELNEKLRRIQEEKQQLHEQHTEAAEKVKRELQQKIEQEKQKSEEISQTLEVLRKKAEKHDELSKEGEEWRGKAATLDEKVRELETDLAQKNASLENLMREKNENAEALDRAQRDLSDAQSREKELNLKITEIQTSVDAVRQESDHELTSLRAREQELLKKAATLEQNIEELNDALRARDEELDHFEKQVQELAGKVAEFEPMRREHAQFVQERNTLRKEYEAKLNGQELRLAKIEDEHRRYKSRTDRKNAAATRELGESVRAVDTVRQVLQKLILFLGSESAVLDTDKKVPLRSPLTRGPSAANSEKS